MSWQLPKRLYCPTQCCSFLINFNGRVNDWTAELRTITNILKVYYLIGAIFLISVVGHTKSGQMYTQLELFLVPMECLRQQVAYLEYPAPHNDNRATQMFDYEIPQTKGYIYKNRNCKPTWLII